MAAVCEALGDILEDGGEETANHRRTFEAVGWGDALVTLPPEAY